MLKAGEEGLQGGGYLDSCEQKRQAGPHLYDRPGAKTGWRLQFPEADRRVKLFSKSSPPESIARF